MIAYMQTNTTQKALAAGLKKAQQTTEKERRSVERKIAQGGGTKAAYTALPAKDKASYTRALEERFYRARSSAAATATESAAPDTAARYASSGRAHGGRAGSFGGDALYEQRRRQKDEARQEAARRIFDVLGSAAAQSQNARAGYLASPSQQLALARRQTDNVQTIKASSEKFKVANRAIDWGGREELIREYKRLQAGSNRANDGTRYSREERDRRIRDIRTELETRDAVAGNGLRNYSFLDDVGSLADLIPKELASAGINAFSNIGQLYSRGLVHTYTPEEALIDRLTGTDPKTHIGQKIAANESDESQAMWRHIDAAADRLEDSVARESQKVKEGKSLLGEFGVDLAENAVMMGLDAAFAASTGGSALIPMAARVYGQSVGKARRAGANLEQQAGYALTNTAIELASEKLFDGVAGIYGAGAADEITEELVRRLACSDTGRTLLRCVIGAAGEGTEELVSDLLSPLAEAMVRDESVAELYRRLDPADLLYDYLIGSAIGLFGSGAGIAAGQNAEANRTLRDLDANEAAYLRRMEEIGHLTPEGDKNAAPGRAAESTAVNTDPAKHTAVEQTVIDEYQDAVDERIKAQILRARSIQNENYRNKYSVILSLSVGEQVIALVKNATGLDISGYRNILKGNALRHIDKRHGENGRADHSLADINDLSRINYVIENADGATLLTKDDVDSETWRLSREYNNADNTPAPLIRFYKAVNGTYYVVEAVPDSAAHRIAVVSAYMKVKEKSESSTD